VILLKLYRIEKGFISAAADGSSSLLSRTKRLYQRAFFMLFTVYILYAEKFNKHYTGYSSNLSARLLSHNELGQGWTVKYRPWKLIYTKEFEAKQEAMAYEKWLKTGVGRDYIKKLGH
jgi:putative endonuclease